MNDDKGKNGWGWKRACPVFSGIFDEYKAWKGRVEDWLVITEGEVKYPGLEIRLSLMGKAMEVTEGMERDKLKTSDGSRIILQKLDEIFLKDSLVENYGKMKSYFRIERDSEEKIRDFIIRYEKIEAECTRALGKKMLEGEGRGFHLLEQANLTDNQKQMVLAACGQGKLEYEVVSKVLKRIFEGLGGKSGADGEWYSSECSGRYRNFRGNYHGRGRGVRGRGVTGRNPSTRDGRVTLCTICKSEWHWARECPQNILNKGRAGSNASASRMKKPGEKMFVGDVRGGERDVEGVYVGECVSENGTNVHDERIYVGEVGSVEDEPWGEVDAILDTGCKSTVCGEL